MKHNGNRAEQPQPGALSLNTATHEDDTTVKTVRKTQKTTYPWWSMALLMTVTVGQSYAAPGLQAILELYFSRFLYVCSKHAVRLASTSINVYIAVYQICALLGGYLADRVLGNFKTQVLSNIITSVGIGVVLFSSWQYTQWPPPCCKYLNTTSGGNNTCRALQVDDVVNSVNFHLPPTLNLILVILGLLLFAVGYGCTNAIQSVFIADQFTEEQSKSKERSFSWYYLFCNVGTLGGELGMPVLRQSVGFIISWITVLGTSLPTTVLFLFGYCLFVRKKPARPHCKCCLSRSSVKILNSDESSPLMGEKSTTEPDSSSSIVSTPNVSWKWRLNQLLPFLWLFTPLVVFWAIFFQQNSTWVVQGQLMNCYIGTVHVPPDIMPSVNDVLCIIIIPLLDYLVYPHIEKSMKLTLSALHKLVAGMILAALSFLMAGLLQLYVYLPAGQPYCHGDVSLAWQLPQIVLISFAEILVSVTGLELAYSQAPPDLRSEGNMGDPSNPRQYLHPSSVIKAIVLPLNTVTALWYIAQALGVLLNVAIVQIHIALVYQFFLYFVLMLLVTVVFVIMNCRTCFISARSSQRKKERK